MQIDIEVFRAMLPIDKNRLDEELEMHAVTADRIATMTAAANKAAQTAKRDLDIRLAEIVADLRDSKVPATLVEKEAKRDIAYIKAHTHFLNLQEQHEQWEGLRAAWTSRGYNIKPLGELFAHQYFSVTTIEQDPRASRQARKEMAAGLAAMRQRAEAPPLRRRPS